MERHGQEIYSPFAPASALAPIDFIGPLLMLQPFADSVALYVDGPGQVRRGTDRKRRRKRCGAVIVRFMATRALQEMFERSTDCWAHTCTVALSALLVLIHPGRCTRGSERIWTRSPCPQPVRSSLQPARVWSSQLRLHRRRAPVATASRAF